MWESLPAGGTSVVWYGPSGEDKRGYKNCNGHSYWQGVDAPNGGWGEGGAWKVMGPLRMTVWEAIRI